ncbi:MULTISPECIES: hypothetical protein [unclassified Pseudomonas]|uniref:hypothetical protein n=1 Tax=unclassified Pseudomonas TaxID=196821 RepID=UPI000C87DC05|nr:MULTISPECIES: hypothetical protein [unclassified Pseudomonas]PMX26668.1 hypothetical protein C1Y23_12795 [Pseudomonas sp. GW460-12]PMX34111.1 hypothetical protein C1Y24_14940 [Pseudomonas sp. MPR-R2A4]PMX40991.1 hypothetical protein C1Y26_12440 [Pseudomonas sp. MPR-R2A7]PMX53584.1 hypothetical protein C1Y17_12795 [Pseudomonas sp. MPR-R2A6]PMX90556.1 hypothetical protein C1Y21_15575 [Pseudomonas sp. MPR-R2A3]
MRKSGLVTLFLNGYLWFYRSVGIVDTALTLPWTSVGDGPEDVHTLDGRLAEGFDAFSAALEDCTRYAGQFVGLAWT